MQMVKIPFRYLTLKDENGKFLIRNDVPYLFLFILSISTPFIFLPNANFFHSDGFLDRVGDFSSVLTGFYVAGLIAVATFARRLHGLDGIIQIGKIKFRHKKSEEPEFLTRREYVCSMFGYLSVLSLGLTITTIALVIISDAIPDFYKVNFQVYNLNMSLHRSVVRAIFIIFFSIPLGHLAVTTFRGLYYLVDRLYAEQPKINKKSQIDIGDS